MHVASAKSCGSRGPTSRLLSNFRLRFPPTTDLTFPSLLRPLLQHHAPCLSAGVETAVLRAEALGPRPCGGFKARSRRVNLEPLSSPMNPSLSYQSTRIAVWEAWLTSLLDCRATGNRINNTLVTVPFTVRSRWQALTRRNRARSTLVQGGPTTNLPHRKRGY
jgi:hypothetical protein